MKIFDEFGEFIGTIVPFGGAFGGLLMIFLGLSLFTFWAIFYLIKEGFKMIKQGNPKGWIYILGVILFLIFGWLVSAKG